MKWGEHLLGAIIVGIILVLIYEIYTGETFAGLLQEPISKYGAGLVLAILILLVLIIWSKSSRG